MNPLPPILVLHLFPPERQALLDLLAPLTGEEWARPTVCPGWSVKDIAAHILADDLGRLSRGRDGHSGAAFVPSNPARFEAELLDFINRMNEAWVAAARRLSPRVLVDLLCWSGEETQRYFQGLDLFALGEPVSWAGPQPAPVWLDIAREYTERWLHQQHLRDALGRPLLTSCETFAPVLDTFVLALPHTYRNVDAPEGTHVRLAITGEAGGEWSLVRRDGRWHLVRDVDGEPDASVRVDQNTAWRFFTKGMSKEDALARSDVTGDRVLGLVALDTVAIIA